MSDTPGRHQSQPGDEQPDAPTQPADTASDASGVTESALPERGVHSHERTPEPPTAFEPLPPATVTPAGTEVAMSAGAVAPSPTAAPRPVGTVRSPIGGWLLNLITLGIYGLFWYYRVNSELRNFDRSISVKPGLAVLSLFIPIVGLVSIYNTGHRIRQAQAIAGAQQSASGLVGVLLAFVFALYLPYYNSQANQAWMAAGAR